ncbi:MAG: precorrin-2 C(20)-methyltransferase [Alphaproteobacteria bacterium]|jgi:precorrin-2/cobalt-factor-2 C20-methyltransferase|nr:precorrin-2 C(20)-methyltransferase [Alphaproteobacteria bacterium]
MTGTLYGLGVGPGDPELITVKALRLLEAATVVAYPAPEAGESLARSIVADYIPGDAEEIAIRMPLHSDRFPLDEIYDTAAEDIAGHLRAGRDVAVLCEGDPFFYGSFMYLFGRMAEDFRVEVVPGVSSPMACAAVLGAPLAAKNDVLTVIPAPLPSDDIRRRLEASDASAIIKVGRHFPRIRDLLDDMQVSDRARYVEHATMASQRILPLSAVDSDSTPYFSMILLHARGEAWRQ